MISVFGALDMSIDKVTTNYNRSSDKDNDLMEILIKKFNSIHNINLKIDLMDKIIKRIEVFND